MNMLNITHIRPHIRQFIYHYRFRDIIDLPLYRGCYCVNKNGTRKQICYSEQCTHPTDKVIGKRQKINTKSILIRLIITG